MVARMHGGEEWKDPEISYCYLPLFEVCKRMKMTVGHMYFIILESGFRSLPSCLPDVRLHAGCSATQGFIVVGAVRWAQYPPNSSLSEEKKM